MREKRKIDSPKSKDLVINVSNFSRVLVANAMFDFSHGTMRKVEHHLGMATPFVVNRVMDGYHYNNKRSTINFQGGMMSSELLNRRNFLK